MGKYWAHRGEHKITWLSPTSVRNLISFSYTAINWSYFRTTDLRSLAPADFIVKIYESNELIYCDLGGV